MRRQQATITQDLIAGTERAPQPERPPQRPDGLILIDSDSDADTDLAIQAPPPPLDNVPADPCTTFPHNSSLRERTGARTPPLCSAYGTSVFIDLQTPASGHAPRLSEIMPLTAAPTEFSPTSPSYTPTPLRYPQGNGSARSSISAPHSAMGGTMGLAVSSLRESETQLSFSQNRRLWL